MAKKSPKKKAPKKKVTKNTKGKATAKNAKEATSAAKSATRSTRKALPKNEKSKSDEESESDSDSVDTSPLAASRREARASKDASDESCNTPNNEEQSREGGEQESSDNDNDLEAPNNLTPSLNSTPKSGAADEELSPQGKEFRRAQKFMDDNTVKVKMEVSPTILIFQDQMLKGADGKWASQGPQVNHNNYLPGKGASLTNTMLGDPCQLQTSNIPEIGDDLKFFLYNCKEV